MTFNTLNNNGAGIQNLGACKIKDFKVKMKVAKVLRWFKGELEILQAGFDALEEKYQLENRFNEMGVWDGSLDDRSAFVIETKAKLKEKIELLSTECETENTVTFSDEELKTLTSLTGDDLSSLLSLGLLAE